MISNLEKLSSTLRSTGAPQNDEASRLAAKIKSDPQVQEELRKNGRARVTDSTGRTFVVKRTAQATAAASSRTEAI
jgi:ribosomal protein S6